MVDFRGRLASVGSILSHPKASPTLDLPGAVIPVSTAQLLLESGEIRDDPKLTENQVATEDKNPRDDDIVRVCGIETTEGQMAIRYESQIHSSWTAGWHLSRSATTLSTSLGWQLNLKVQSVFDSFGVLSYYFPPLRVFFHLP